MDNDINLEIEQVLLLILDSKVLSDKLSESFPESSNLIELFRTNPNNNIVRDSLMSLINKLKDNGLFINIINQVFDLLSGSIDVRGNIYKIKANTTQYKLFIQHALDNNWFYNSLSVLPSGDEWLIFFG